MSGDLGKQIDKQTELIAEYRKLKSTNNQNNEPSYERNFQNTLLNSLPLIGDKDKSYEAVKTTLQTFDKIQSTASSNTKSLVQEIQDMADTDQFIQLNNLDQKIETNQTKQKALLQLNPQDYQGFNAYKRNYKTYCLIGKS